MIMNNPDVNMKTNAHNDSRGRKPEPVCAYLGAQLWSLWCIRCILFSPPLWASLQNRTSVLHMHMTNISMGRATNCTRSIQLPPRSPPPPSILPFLPFSSILPSPPLPWLKTRPISFNLSSSSRKKRSHWYATSTDISAPFSRCSSRVSWPPSTLNAKAACNNWHRHCGIIASALSHFVENKNIRFLYFSVLLVHALMVNPVLTGELS